MPAKPSFGWSYDGVLLASLLCSVVTAQISLSQLSKWPTASVASGSSTHDPLSDGTTFFASNAIDGDITTKWNDDTLNHFPDTLLITTPQSVTLTGLVILSADDGWLTSYSIDTAASDSSPQFVTVASNKPETKLSNVTFGSPIACDTVRVTVQSSSKGDFSRIFEVYPIYMDQTTTTPLSTNVTAAGTQNSVPEVSSSSSSTSSSSSSSWQASRTGLLIGGIMIGVGAIALSAAIVFFLLRRRRSRRELPQKAGVGQSWFEAERSSKLTSEYVPYAPVRTVPMVELDHANPARPAHNGTFELA